MDPYFISYCYGNTQHKLGESTAHSAPSHLPSWFSQMRLFLALGSRVSAPASGLERRCGAGSGVGEGIVRQQNILVSKNPTLTPLGSRAPARSLLPSLSVGSLYTSRCPNPQIMLSPPGPVNNDISRSFPYSMDENKNQFPVRNHCLWNVRLLPGSVLSPSPRTPQR